ncbi:MAG: terpene cyclase/mutase family protein [Asgard group archaeon]|nr:terpene cyclase/mutase family protein [Asgard group archaeon]
MTWLPLLLGDASPSLRLLVLKELLHKDVDDKEIKELIRQQQKDPLITALLAIQQKDGSWSTSESLGLLLDSPIRNTSLAMIRLGYLGLQNDHPAIQKAAEYLFTHQFDDGAWPRQPGRVLHFIHPTHGPAITPKQTADPLFALAISGFAEDSRAEKAYEWLIEHRAEDGSWPTIFSPDGKIGYQPVGYRQLPNSRFGCRTNSTSALNAFAYHPKRRNTDVPKRVLDLLLSRETKDRNYLGFEVARIIGIEPAHGFLTFHGRYDLALILNLCWRIGATTEDPRVANMVKYLQEVQGTYGLWDYIPNPQATRWVTFDILRSLSHLDESGDWISTEPRTKYKSYPRAPRRF